MTRWDTVMELLKFSYRGLFVREILVVTKVNSAVWLNLPT